MISEKGGLSVLLDAGARILECACGPCIGMGLAPNSGGVSVRTFNRNFLGRSGTKDAKVYLVSPEVAAATAIKGYLSSAETLDFEEEKLPDIMSVNDALIIKPNFRNNIQRGPNIVKLGKNSEVKLPIKQSVLLKLDDNITTDHIIPGGNNVLRYRSNLPKLSEFAFLPVVDDFYIKAKNKGGGIIVAGDNYGQGSSREHAAMIPKYLGIDVIIAKSFARIHLANLVNSGILPLVFENADDYDLISEKDELTVSAGFEITGNNYRIKLNTPLTENELHTVYKGGLLNQIKETK